MADVSFDHLIYKVEDHIAEVIFNRPPLNLINEELTLEFHAALKSADADADVRVIVLSGEGRGLSGGLDLKMVESFDKAQMKNFLRLFYIETMNIGRNLSKPLITMVHGYAREGALTLAFAGDMIIAADDSDFGYPAVPNLAGPPGMHVWFLQRILGRMRAAELIFTGEPLEAKTAEQLGLITRAVPADSLREETMKLAAKIGAMSLLALSRTRKLFYEFEDANFDDVPERALEALSSAFDSEDNKEAIAAFKEKRPPVWKGK